MNTSSKKDNKPQESLEWKASEYSYIKAHPLWYVLLLLFTLIIALGLVLASNIFGAITIIICATALGVYNLLEPREVSYRVVYNGVSINETFIPYKKIKGFLLDKKHNEDIILKMLRGFDKVIVVKSSKKSEVIKILSGHLRQI